MDPAPQRVTPYLLRAGPTLCPRRLALELDAEPGVWSPPNRARLRDAFLHAARTDLVQQASTSSSASGAPASLQPEDAPASLQPEERSVYRQLRRWYRSLYGARAAQLVLHDCDSPSDVPGLDVRLGGWVDLTVRDDSGTLELRQFAPWNHLPTTSVMDVEHIQLAVVRLSKTNMGRPMRVSAANLLNGELTEEVIDTEALVPELIDTINTRVTALRSRADRDRPVPGDDCQSCRFIASCRAVRGAAPTSTPRDDLRPSVITLHPTANERWARCQRLWFLADVLRLPVSNASAAGDHGQFVHEMLRMIHQTGTCHDATHVSDLLDAHGVPETGRVRDEIAAHARNCPIAATSLGHERTVVRFHRPPGRVFLVSARIDALWSHDGVLDVRDYKTGALHLPRVADDPQARLQAWVLAPEAEGRGLRLRLQYEYLSNNVADDPDPFEPDADEIDAIGIELDQVVTAMWSTDDFMGVADQETCGICRYRSICRDSAAPAPPGWPQPMAEGDEPATNV